MNLSGIAGIETVAAVWMEAFWRACWQGGAFILVIWGLCRLVPRLPTAFQYWLWWLACLKLVLGFAGLPPVPLPILPSAAPEGIVSASGPTYSPVPFLPHPERLAADSAASTTSVGLLLGLLWIAGVTVYLFVVARNALALRALRKASSSLADSETGAEARRIGALLGLSRPPVMLACEAASAPMVIDPVCPAIVLPIDFAARFSLEEQRMALAHELAHIRRRDLWLGLVPALAHALFFFFPPAWLASSEWVLAREAACDEEALAVTGAAPGRYAALLLKVVSNDSRSLPQALGATSSYFTLKRRLLRMRHTITKANWQLRFGAMALLGLALIFLIPWRVTAQSPPAGGAADTHRNALRNAGFESGSDGTPAEWTQGARVAGVQSVWDKQVAHAGKASLRLSRETQRYWPIAQWTQTIPYPAGARQVRLSAWIRARKAYKAVLDVQFRSDTDDWSHHWAAYIGAKKPGDPPADHDWHKYEGTVEIPPHTRQVVIGLQLYGPGTVWFDDVDAEFIR